MSQYGIVRFSHQTQREFSDTARRFLIDRNVAGDVISIPEKVIEAYYRVRFGEQKLDDSEFGSVQEALKRLELALANDSASANALHAMVE